MSKFFSRKFIIAILVTLLAGIMPLIYKKNGVSDSITLAVLAILGGVATAYGLINVKDSKLDILKVKEIVNVDSPK